MSWDDVEKIIFDGTAEQIDAVKCPECGGRLKMLYSPKTRNIEIYCKDCYTVVRSHGAEKTPNFALIRVN